MRTCVLRYWKRLHAVTCPTSVVCVQLIASIKILFAFDFLVKSFLAKSFVQTLIISCHLLTKFSAVRRGRPIHKMIESIDSYNVYFAHTRGKHVLVKTSHCISSVKNSIVLALTGKIAWWFMFCSNRNGSTVCLARLLLVRECSAVTRKKSDSQWSNMDGYGDVGISVVSSWIIIPNNMLVVRWMKTSLLKQNYCFFTQRWTA